MTWRPRGLAELVKRLLDLCTGDVGMGPGQSVTVSHWHGLGVWEPLCRRLRKDQ